MSESLNTNNVHEKLTVKQVKGLGEFQREAHKKSAKSLILIES